MKITLLSLMLLASTAFAQSFEREHVLARADGQYAGLRTVALLASGSLHLVNKSNRMTRVQLNPVVFGKLVQEIKGLRGVVLVERNDLPAVCTMIVPPIDTLHDLQVANFDDQLMRFGSPRLILTRLGCYMSAYTYPENEESHRAAQALREQLVILGLSNLPALD